MLFRPWEVLFGNFLKIFATDKVLANVTVLGAAQVIKLCSGRRTW